MNNPFKSKMSRRRNSGFSLIELLIALTILVIGLLGGMVVIVTAIATNARNRFDTAALALAQSTMDRILVLSASGSTQSTSVTDCNGVVHAISTAPGDSPGPGAPLTNLGNIVNGTQSIDFSATAVNGYQMFYTLCAAGASGEIGNEQVYDVRWNIINTTAGSTGAQLVVVAAKNITASGNGLGQARFFSVPMTLRAIRGN